MLPSQRRRECSFTQQTRSQKHLIQEQKKLCRKQTPLVEQQPPGRRRAPGGVTGKGSPQTSARKKPTVATLADSLEKLSQALPAITTQLQDLSSRTAAIEANVANPPDKSSILRQPLSSSALVGSSNVVGPQALVKEMPPPRSLSTPAKVVPKNLFTEKKTKEMAMDFPESPALAQAVLEQSRALTALVAQMANGDRSLELPSGSGLSSRGSIGREKLRNELAQHKGTFFTNVIQNMSRRMHPTMPAEVDAAALIQRGVTPPLYLERFGGYGRTRDLGFIIWQVSIAMAYMQQENFPAAMDSLALLFVCLEQSAMDNGRMDLGLTLALVEDPPHSLFSARSIAASSEPQTICSDGQPEVGASGPAVLEGVRHHSHTASGSGLSKSTSNPEPIDTSHHKPKAQAKAKSMGKGKANRATAGTGGGIDRSLSDEARLTEDISFLQFLASLPRWVLRSRTRFGSFLSKSFHVKRTGSCPSSAIFPLPAPRLGLFEPQGSPSTSATQWKKLCLQRALHVVVMALNFVHNGLRFPDLDLLGRCPNALQLSVFRRLRALWLRVTFLVDSLSLLAGPVLNSLRVLSSSSILPALFLRWTPIPTLVPLWTLNLWKRLVGSGLNIAQFSAIQPYRSLVTSRLKISGTGLWPLADFLDGILWLPYQEPLVLEHHQDVVWSGPDLKGESKEENLGSCVFGIARVCLHCSMSLILQVLSAVFSMPIRMKALTVRLETEGGSMEVSLTPKRPPVTFQGRPAWPRCTAR